MREKRPETQKMKLKKWTVYEDFGKPKSSELSIDRQNKKNSKKQFDSMNFNMMNLSDEFDSFIWRKFLVSGTYNWIFFFIELWSLRITKPIQRLSIPFVLRRQISQSAGFSPQKNSHVRSKLSQRIMVSQIRVEKK